MKKKHSTTCEEAGRRGGLSTLKRHGKRKMRAWGCLGGRPPGKGKKKPKRS